MKGQLKHFSQYFCCSPAVRKLSSVGKLNEARSKHSDEVFFLYIGDDDEQDDLYVSIFAEMFVFYKQINAFFLYSILLSL